MLTGAVGVGVGVGEGDGLLLARAVKLRALDGLLPVHPASRREHGLSARLAQGPEDGEADETEEGEEVKDEETDISISSALAARLGAVTEGEHTHTSKWLLFWCIRDGGTSTSTQGHGEVSAPVGVCIERKRAMDA